MSTVPERTTWRRKVAWNVPFNQLANTSRRKVLTTSVMSAISLTVRSSTATSEENRAKSVGQWTDPMTSVHTNDGVRISAVPPLMLKREGNPGVLPIDVLDGLRQQLVANRAQFYFDFASGPFYGYNRPGVTASPAVIWNWWRQGMMGDAKAHYDGIKAFSETDFTEDLKSITVPKLVLHGGDDQIVPVSDSAPLSAKLLKKA